MPKKSKQIFKYLENEKSFSDVIKNLFIIFEGISLKQIKKFFLEDGSTALNILRTKRAFKIKQKAFFIICKGLSMKQITEFIFRRWKSDFKLGQTRELSPKSLGISFKTGDSLISLDGLFCHKCPSINIGYLWLH